MMKSAPRAGASASEHRFLTFTELPARLPRSGSIPPGGGGGPLATSLATSLISLQFHGQFVKLHGDIAKKHGLHICAHVLEVDHLLHPI